MVRRLVVVICPDIARKVTNRMALILYFLAHYLLSHRLSCHILRGHTLYLLVNFEFGRDEYQYLNRQELSRSRGLLESVCPREFCSFQLMHCHFGNEIDLRFAN